MEPIKFQPIYKTRVWGGRSLEHNYARTLPDEQPYGEAWEMVDRPNEQSRVQGGPYHGLTLNQLWQNHRDKIFGPSYTSERFPLLMKILDARDDLSLQVHPPATVAPALGGEPKTEMWYVAAADPEAKIYAGLKPNVSRQDFEHALKNGTLADTVHTLHPKAGDSIFIPSGRLHAIGAGLLIFEIQQNSDTTYRVYDWNRLGLDGQPRELHIEASLRSIDFQDIEPKLTPAQHTPNQIIADCPHFQVTHRQLQTQTALPNPTNQHFSLITVLTGEIITNTGHTYHPGDLCLLPPNPSTEPAPPKLTTTQATTLLQTTIPPQS